MTSWIEPPPKRKGMGCIGKGCLLIIVFLILLAVAFVVGVYVGTQPKEMPQLQTSEADQNAVKARWDEFEAGNRSEPPVNQMPAPAPSMAPDETPAPETVPVPVETPPPANRIELTANDINGLIASSRKARGKGFVSIDNNVARVQVTFPLDKVPGLRGRFANAELAVRPSPDGNPHNIQITKVSVSGVPEAVLNTLLGSRPVQSYVDDFANTHGITSFTIENNKVILEKAPGR